MARRQGLVGQARQLVAALLTLAQLLARMTATELVGNLAATRGPLAIIAVALVLLLTALVLLVVAIVLALAQLVGALAATVIVALLSLLAGWALARHGLARLSGTRLAPTRSIATLEAQIDRFARHDRAGGKDD